MTHFTDAPRLPVIDLSLFEIGNPWRDHVAAQIDWAAADFGCFRVINHGIEPALIESLMTLSRRFFAREIAAERRLRAMAAGIAGFSEELCFDEEFIEDDAHALSAFASRDREVFFQLPGFRDVVRDYMTAVTGLAHRLMTSFARGLHLGDTYFVDRYTGDAVSELRIANGSAALADSQAAGRPTTWLTLLNHDELARLEVRHADHVIDVPYLSGALICGVGESLERLTGGRYASARYRLVGHPGRGPLATPFYFGAGIGADIEAAHHLRAPVASAERARAA